MDGLPTGMVALLFTDVEGSTRLVQELGDEYSAVMGDHRRLVREAFEPLGGHEIDCRGDEFFIAFASTRDALRAALAAQQALGEHEWPSDTPLRVRMGIHTGEPTPAEGGYVGLDVHRAARICAAGHGGQVLASHATYELVAADEELEFRDLGEHALKGIPRPERIYQLLAPGLPEEFGQLRVADGEAPASELAEGAGGPRLRVVLAEDSVLLREG